MTCVVWIIISEDQYCFHICLALFLVIAIDTGGWWTL